MKMKTLRVALVVEVNVRVPADAYDHADATGEIMETINTCVGEVEADVQQFLGDRRKRLSPVVGADYGSLYFPDSGRCPRPAAD